MVQKGAALRAAPFGIIFLCVYLSLLCVFDPQASLLCQPLLAQPIKSFAEASCQIALVDLDWAFPAPKQNRRCHMSDF